MERLSAGPWLAACGVLMLAACADDPTGVPPNRAPSASFSSCNGEASARVVSASVSNPLPVWTVRATFSAASLGIPFDLVTSMNFPSSVNIGPVPCLNTSETTFSTEAALADTLPLPVPSGVDPDFWSTLSPREQRALIKWAEAMMQMNPAKYNSLGSVIAQYFRETLTELKAKSKIRAMDYFGGTIKGELLSAGIYGCMLYRRFAHDPYSPWSWAESLQLSADLVTAFGEAQFANRPLTGLLFGKNGVYGAGLASADYSNIDCGYLVFTAVNAGRISVLDPYGSSGSGSANPLLPPPQGPEDAR